METIPLIIEHHYDVPINQVWQAITEQNQMKEWYFEIDKFEAEKGFPFAFTAGSGGIEYRHACEVLVCEAPAVLSYSWRYPDYRGESVVTWKLTAVTEGSTHLRLTHTGLESFPQDNPDFAIESFTEGWNYFVKEALAAYLETGTIEKEVTIDASAEVIWDIVLNPTNQWALAFGEGTRVRADWREGSDVVWLDAEGQVCAYGIVREHRPQGYLQVNMYDETVPKPDVEVGIYAETYALAAVEDGRYRLRITSGPLPKEDIVTHAPMWDKVVEMIKEIAEVSRIRTNLV